MFPMVNLKYTAEDKLNIEVIRFLFFLQGKYKTSFWEKKKVT